MVNETYKYSINVTYLGEIREIRTEYANVGAERPFRSRDWLNNWTVVQDVDSQISTMKDGRVDLVCHSNGGLEVGFIQFLERMISRHNRIIDLEDQVKMAMEADSW